MPGDNVPGGNQPFIKPTVEEFNDQGILGKINGPTKDALMHQLKMAKEKAGADSEEYRTQLLNVLEHLQQEASNDSQETAKLLTENIDIMVSSFEENSQESK